MKRLKAHEHLEKETIKASALRHRLANLPYKLKAELTGLYTALQIVLYTCYTICNVALVASARDSNTAQIHALQV